MCDTFMWDDIFFSGARLADYYRFYSFNHHHHTHSLSI